MISRIKKIIQSKEEMTKAKAEVELALRKEKVRSFLESKLDKQAIEEYNSELIANSAGWLGGDYRELDIKRSVLRQNCEIFTKEEYMYFENLIKKIAECGFKNDIITSVTTPWNDDYLANKNRALLRRNTEIIKSPLSEVEFKRFMIYGNADIFSEEEINYLLDNLYAKVKVK